MTKADIIDTVHERLGAFSKNEAKAAVEAVLDVMKEALLTQGHVKIHSFGRRRPWPNRARRAATRRRDARMKIAAARYCVQSRATCCGHS